MERSKYHNVLDTIKEQAKTANPGVLPPGKTMDNHIGHTVINLSNVNLSSDQISALQKGLTFCPTPGKANKAIIWNDFKDFYRRLCLKYHFHQDNGHFSYLSPDERELVDFMAQNLEESESPYENINKKFVNKSTWKPPRVHNSSEVFQRAFKNGLLKSNIRMAKNNNLTKAQYQGLMEISKNPELVIKKADK